jgi:hypothetical protein
MIPLLAKPISLDSPFKTNIGFLKSAENEASEASGSSTTGEGDDSESVSGSLPECPAENCANVTDICIKGTVL